MTAALHGGGPDGAAAATLPAAGGVAAELLAHQVAGEWGVCVVPWAAFRAVFAGMAK